MFAFSYQKVCDKLAQSHRIVVQSSSAVQARIVCDVSAFVDGGSFLLFGLVLVCAEKKNRYEAVWLSFGRWKGKWEGFWPGVEVLDRSLTCRAAMACSSGFLLDVLVSIIIN